jgi:hypothetical protein
MHHEGDGRLSKSIWAQEPILTPERKVWRAVLGQAYADAELAPFSDGAEVMERTLARRFLRGDGIDEKETLEVVCDFAGVPADRVILWARRRYPAESPFVKGVECGSAAAALATEPVM